MVEAADQELLIPLGEAEIKREGSDVTIICYAQTVPLALAAAEHWRKKRSARKCSICVRSSRSIGRRFSNSVSKTHRVVIAEQDRPFCGVGVGNLLSDSTGNFR